MKLLSICDPTRYGSPPLDVPTFYQRLSLDPRVEFYHIPAPQVLTSPTPQIQVAEASGELSYERFLDLGNQADQWMDLSDIDLVFCRTLKPFPQGYLDQLTHWESLTRFINRPSSKKGQIQADFLVQIAQNYMPEAIATIDWTEALAFFERFQVIVAKRANSCGGKGVFKIWYDHGAFQTDNVLVGRQSFPTFPDLMAYLQSGQTIQVEPEPIQFCRYLHHTQAGDKRVVVVDGEIYGGYLRRSQSGHWVHNVSNDGECVLAAVTPDEVEAIQRTVGHYQALGLHTLGYDFLQDDDGVWRISEINAGNIGGFARLELLTGQPVMNRLIDWLIDYAQRPSSQAMAVEQGMIAEVA
ncbi:MAG: hypothetical protein F6K30_20765 [Cyanothece sp. SIO2G6]|nr:hypothetical protein [Cyanothece sp. SIO2G6]